MITLSCDSHPTLGHISRNALIYVAQQMSPCKISRTLAFPDSPSRQRRAQLVPVHHLDRVQVRTLVSTKLFLLCCFCLSLVKPC